MKNGEIASHPFAMTAYISTTQPGKRESLQCKSAKNAACSVYYIIQQCFDGVVRHFCGVDSFPVNQFFNCLGAAGFL